MANATKEYDVHRSMGDGKNAWERGDTRELTETDAAPLLATGALSEKGKAPERVINKMEHASEPPAPDPDNSDSRVEGRRSPARKA